jgi:hypothetical protein
MISFSLASFNAFRCPQGILSMFLEDFSLLKIKKESVSFDTPYTFLDFANCKEGDFYVI